MRIFRFMEKRLGDCDCVEEKPYTDKPGFPVIEVVEKSAADKLAEALADLIYDCKIGEPDLFDANQALAEYLGKA